MNALPPKTHNNPPDPIDEATAPYQDAIHEAGVWLDGTAVENVAQMKAVDAIAKQVRAARADLDRAKKSATAPLHDAWKAELARWKPTEDDLDRIQKGLAAAVDIFKRKLAAEKAEAERKARAEAEAKMRAARETAERANAADLEAQRAAAMAKAEADEAVRAAREAAKDTVKGLRAHTDYVVVNDLEMARWIWANDRAAQIAFMAEYARRNKLDLPGVVETRTERRAV